MDMNNLSKNKHPYIEEYLEPLIGLHKLLFEKIADQMDFDAYSMIDVYMRYSPIRQKMDVGNWVALNKGWKQLWNDIPTEKCKTYDDSYILDEMKAHWMATIYVLFQWMYNISSKEISEKIPATELSNIYNPLHETSERIACRKLLHKYFPDKENSYD